METWIWRSIRWTWKIFFDKTDYSNNEFQNMIQKKHYPVHLNIQMYYKNSDVNEINNYDQFLISSCQLIIFIVDNVFVELCFFIFGVDDGQ